MSHWYVYVIGFTAQILFSGRLLVQWVLSERNKKVLTPSLFWKLSLVASFLLFVYGYLRQDFAIMLGQAMTYFIYIRNLQLQGEWQKQPWIVRAFLNVFPVIIMFYGYNNGSQDIHMLLHNEDVPYWLLILGICAQVVFNLRFVYQWIYSERRKLSSLPLGFWMLSLFGALMILTYAIFRLDPVLFLGHIFGSVVYIRNIVIGQRAKEKEHEA